MRITGTQFWCVFTAIVVLRFAVGLHFFTEGATKIRSGDFSAAPFFRAATGPFATLAEQMLDDPDGRLRLCIQQTEDADGQIKFVVDTELTEAIWDDFVDRAVSYYRFGDPALEAELIARRKALAEQIRTARENRDSQVDTRQLEARRHQDELAIHALRHQTRDARQLLDRHVEELQTWVDAHQQEILAWWHSRDRAEGFGRDGAARREVADEVESLREQTDKIVSERNQKLAQWSGDLEAMWDSLETGINALAVDAQAKMPPLAIHRPFAQPHSALQWINRIVPWFDLIVGACLVLGLMTRLASLAGAVFLAAIIMLQPPWVPDAVATWPQMIELAALLVLGAIGAGRFGGLDFFLDAWRARKTAACDSEPTSVAATQGT